MNENNNYDPTSVPQPMMDNTPPNIGNDGYGAQVTSNNINPNMGNPLNNQFSNTPVMNNTNMVNPGNFDNNMMYNGNVNQTNPNTVGQNMNMNATPVVNNTANSEPAVNIPSVPESPIAQVANQMHINEMNDDLLLLAFIGKNCEKITTRSFNFAGFFFSSLYMFYRKMFGYGLLFFIGQTLILNLINIPVLSLGINILTGFLVNKLYVSFANKKIDVIKAQNIGKSMDELKYICAKKGGTSFGKVILGFLAEIGIAIVIVIIFAIVGLGGAIGQMFKSGGFNINFNGGTVSTPTDIKGERKLIENAEITGQSTFGNSRSIMVGPFGKSETYVVATSNPEVISALYDYKDYLKVDLYYAEQDGEKYIVDAKIYIKETNEDISDVKTKDELESKLGLYGIGTHTDTFTLTNIGTPGFGINDSEQYTFVPFEFTNEKNMKIEMKYKNYDNSIKMVIGRKYEVTFEVVEGTFDNDYEIKSIKPL